MAQVALGRREPDRLPDLTASGQAPPQHELYVNFICKSVLYHDFQIDGLRQVAHRRTPPPQGAVFQRASNLVLCCVKNSPAPGYQPPFS